MKFINLENIKNLQAGSIVRHKNGSVSYVVTANYGNRATAVRTIDITNPSEWEILKLTDNPNNVHWN